MTQRPATRRSTEQRPGSRADDDRPTAAVRTVRPAGTAAGEDGARRTAPAMDDEPIPTPVGGTPAVRRAQRPEPPEGPVARLIVPPETDGPRVRLGFLWFFLALAAITGGRWWTAMLVAGVAALAAIQVARAWVVAGFASRGEDADRGSGAASEPDAAQATVGDQHGAGLAPVLVAGVAAASVPLAAGYGTGLAGVALLVVAVVAGAFYVVVSPRTGAVVAIASVLAALPALAIVLALRADLWAALFLVLAVSLYDAGNFLLGAEAAGRWEGPLAGAMGVLAVTFTMATIGVAPFDRPQWWISGVLVAATCVVGQWVTSYFLPSPTSWVPAMRRLDAYVVAGPVFVACTWLLGS